MKAIRLFARINVSWRSTVNKAPDEVTQFLKEEVMHEVQMPKVDIKYTDRKKNPVDVEVSFYDLETLKQISEHYTKEKEAEKNA